ncbi:hypothetical protein B0H14DRAFT_3530623 [Mycena olivaceomarginata]|nr:hypothetical protein B0H14DRAFT_3530623 [Mycena olivaceomarginata]
MGADAAGGISRQDAVLFGKHHSILLSTHHTKILPVVSKGCRSGSLVSYSNSARGLGCSRALSLVSKDSRIISAPFKLQSIALVGAKPILRFLCILETTKESLRNVQSLFIGCPNLRLVSRSCSRLDLADEHSRGLAFTDRLFPGLGSTPHAHTVEINTDAIQQAVVRILGRTAGTLRVLHTHLTFLERQAALIEWEEVDEFREKWETNN